MTQIEVPPIKGDAGTAGDAGTCKKEILRDFEGYRSYIADVGRLGIETAASLLKKLRETSKTRIY